MSLTMLYVILCSKRHIIISQNMYIIYKYYYIVDENYLLYYVRVVYKKYVLYTFIIST